MLDGCMDRLFIFQGLTLEQRTLVQPLFVPVKGAAGDVIFEQGDQAEFLYILFDGEVSIRYKPDDGPQLSIARVRSEGVVGWSAALGSPCYTSSAVCMTDCKMLRVRGENLRSIYEHHPETGEVILERLAAMIAERLRNTHEHVIALLEQGLKFNFHSQVQGTNLRR